MRSELGWLVVGGGLGGLGSSQRDASGEAIPSPLLTGFPHRPTRWGCGVSIAFASMMWRLGFRHRWVSERDSDPKG